MSKFTNRAALLLTAVAALALTTGAQAEPEKKEQPTATSKPARGFPPATIDSNGDGKPDAWDRNGDGKPDAWDKNGDGKPDAVDNDGDGAPDA